MAFLISKIYLDSRESNFTFKVFLLLIAFLAFTNVLNPDAYVARQNMRRYSATGKIDARYLGSLSDDALPVTVPLLKNKDSRIRKQYGDRLRETILLERRPLFSRWQSLNLSRWRAKEILRSSD